MMGPRDNRRIEETKEEEDDLPEMIEEGTPGRNTSGVSPFVEEEMNHMTRQVLKRLKWSVVGMLLVAGTVVATTGFLYGRAQEQTRFEERFQDDAARFISAYYQRIANKIWAGVTLHAAFISTGNYNKDVSWPYVTLPEYDLQTAGHLQTASADSFLWAPLLSSREQRDTWDAYAVENQELAGINGTLSNINNRTIESGIFRMDDNYNLVDDESVGVSAPIWQASPFTKKRHLHMLNLFSIEKLQKTLFHVMGTRIPHTSGILDDEIASFFLGTQERSLPRSLFLSPVLNKRDGSQVVGIIASEIDWASTFENVLNEGPATTIILQSTCDQPQTFEVRDGTAKYVGEGNLHDVKYEHMKLGTTLMGFRDYWNEQIRNELSMRIFPEHEEAELEGSGNCAYNIHIYPTEEYNNKYKTFFPLTFVLVSVVVFGCLIFLFLIYDILVERRQHQVTASAAKSNAMIKSLFPSVVRDRLFQSTGSSLSTRKGSMKRQRSSESWGAIVATNSEFGILPTPTIRLANFLMEGTSCIGDEPIAEMFSNTTVIFADIAGFTAWSSEREPSQVFRLLETIYSAFDSIAKRLGVFKVETIGDCYVAVTGLPQPNKNHAVICAQFAYHCLQAMDQLSHQLELTLGPGTSDLALRIGLHSGPVTAGVLRGEKSRFQLFGDTMNTASRMESTGQAGKIQVSAVTADLISKAGKHYWLTQRDGTVSAKGKGEMETWWLKVVRDPEQTPTKQALAGSMRSVKNSNADHGDDDWAEIPDSLSIQNKQMARLSVSSCQEESLHIWGSVDASSCSRLDTRADRLVDWQVEVLMGFLEKVFQHRLPPTVQTSRLTKPSDDCMGLVIDEVVEVIELPDFVAGSRTKRPSRLSKQLTTVVRTQLKEFVACIASMYRDVPFHNFEHASHVTMSANKLMKRIITPDDHVDGSKPLGPSELHGSTFGISSDPLTQFAVVFAALIHDVDHTGLSNSTLVDKKFAVARIFSNKSVAEQNSVVVAWELLMESRFSDLQTCIFACDSDRKRFRQLVVNAVMATDIMDAGLSALRKNRWEKAFDSFLASSLSQDEEKQEIHQKAIIDSFLVRSLSEDEEKQDIHRKATIVIEHIIQASDVAHTMQHWHIFLKWNARLYNELYRSYKLGYICKDPADGWYEGEIAFFDHYVIPLARKLKECGVFGVSGDEYLQYAEWNRQEWEQKGREETRKMVLQREEDEKDVDSSGSDCEACTFGTVATEAGAWKPSVPCSGRHESPQFSPETISPIKI